MHTFTHVHTLWYFFWMTFKQRKVLYMHWIGIQTPHSFVLFMDVSLNIQLHSGQNQNSYSQLVFTICIHNLPQANWSSLLWNPIMASSFCHVTIMNDIFVNMEWPTFIIIIPIPNIQIYDVIANNGQVGWYCNWFLCWWECVTSHSS